MAVPVYHLEIALNQRGKKNDDGGEAAKAAKELPRVESRLEQKLRPIRCMGR